MTTPSNAASDDPLVGTRIDGRYTLQEPLGQGGMGVVYAGVHDELGRPVAIKVLNTAWASDRNAVERFLREARTASQFTHGNIVDVTDLGRMPDGRPYLVMPRIYGTDLATLLEDVGPQPAKRVAELLRGVASALDLIHARGFVHRDIKPENLMYVAREDGSETVMLLDFGIAAALMSNDRRLTGQGQVFGTPHYMAPESSTGAVPDARSDVYALATVAFELITGVLPFETDNLVHLLSMKLMNDAPSMSSVTGLHFPIALESMIARGLVRNPRDRFPGASTLIEAIAGATQDAPVSWRSGVMRSNMHSGAHPLENLRPDSETPEPRSGPPASRRGTRSAPHSTHPSPRPDSAPSQPSWQDQVAGRRHPSARPPSDRASAQEPRRERTPAGDWQDGISNRPAQREPTPARGDSWQDQVANREPTPARGGRGPTPARADSWQDHVAQQAPREDFRPPSSLPLDREDSWHEDAANPDAYDNWRALSSRPPSEDNWPDHGEPDHWRDAEPESGTSRRPSHAAEHVGARPASRADSAPAFRGGARSDSAPALRGGARSDSAPALRGGASSRPLRYDPMNEEVLGAGLRESEQFLQRHRQRVRTRWIGLGVFALLSAAAALAIKRFDSDQQARNSAVPQRELVPTGPAAAGGNVPDTNPGARADSPAHAAAPSGEGSRADSSAARAPGAGAALGSAASASDNALQAAPPVFDPNNPPPSAAETATMPPPKAATTPPHEAPRGRPEPRSNRFESGPPAARSGDGSSDLGLKSYVPEPPPPAAPAAPVIVLKEHESAPEPEPAPQNEPAPPEPDRTQVTQYTQSATKALLRGEVNRAVELLREATRIAPDHAIAWRSLGLALERAGNNSAAIDAYQHYLSLVPTGAQSEMVRERMRTLRQP